MPLWEIHLLLDEPIHGQKRGDQERARETQLVSSSLLIPAPFPPPSPLSLQSDCSLSIKARYSVVDGEFEGPLLPLPSTSYGSCERRLSNEIRLYRFS